MEDLRIPEYERVVVCDDPTVGLKAIIAVHNSNLGPACGGLRILPYATQEEALTDVLRLAKGMSYKSSLAGIGFGGGKSVITLDPTKKRKDIFHVFGEAVEKLGGKYIAAQDMNTTADDLREVKTKTKHVFGIVGELGSSGDPSPVTAIGTYRAVEAAVQELTGKRSLEGVKVAVQGIGHVGYRLAQLLNERGAKLWVTDIDKMALDRAKGQLDATVVSNDAIYDLDVDIFAPCARGAILNSATIPRLKCKAVVGAANNQLATPEDGMRIHERGILYAPDFAVNAGGIINIFIEYKHKGYVEAEALKKADEIYGTMREIFKRAKESKKPPFVVADAIAEERLYAGGKK